MKKILVIAAHPDDEILGCGATISKYIKNGDEVYVCIVCEGSSGRFKDKYYLTSEEKIEGIINKDINIREESAKKASKSLGVKEIYFLNFPNLELHLIPQLKVNKLIEKHIGKIKPDIIFTHTNFDNNIDHRSVYDSTIISSRGIKKVITFEIIGSTTDKFLPNLFIDIEDTFCNKEKSLKFYEDEIQAYPLPRSLEGIEILAKYRGLSCNKRLAEAFMVIRDIE